MELDHETCYRALVARDVRFDGVFFVGVKTTGIYCRPICTARTPRRASCRFYPSAAAAEGEGFRPCLRCRPELSPGQAPVDAAGRIAAAVAARIEAGALNDGGTIDALADEFQLCSRQLRRVVRSELGVSPVALAQTHRLLLAKRLLSETRLPAAQVAFASGFGSVRRFNAVFHARYRLSPLQLRRSRMAPESGSASSQPGLSAAAGLGCPAELPGGAGDARRGVRQRADVLSHGRGGIASRVDQRLARRRSFDHFRGDFQLARSGAGLRTGKSQKPVRFERPA
jgi:methylphosphotriester-DNA--protein-cysteine methyltransferase